MGQTIKTIKGQKYLYKSVWNYSTKKNEYKCMGNVKNIPTIIDSKDNLSFPSNEEMERTELFRVFECATIDAFLVDLVTEINNDFSSRFTCDNREILELFRGSITNLNKSIKLQGVPPEYAVYFQKLLSKWRKKSPVFAGDNEAEIIPQAV